MADPRFSNLSKDDLDLADHYYETGNQAGLRALAEKSARGEPQRVHIGKRPGGWDNE